MNWLDYKEFRINFHAALFLVIGHTEETLLSPSDLRFFEFLLGQTPCLWSEPVE
jgi:hypothetical protein